MQKPIYELKENPLSTAIYGEDEDVGDLAKSLKETGQLTPLLIKPDGTILSGHRRYRAARKAGLILLNVEVRTPKSMAEEELIIIAANKQREKTAEQFHREIVRLRGIYGAEGKAQISAAVSKANAARGQNPTFLETKKVGTDTQPEPPFNIEAAYQEAVERTEQKPAPEPVNMNKRIAKELGISTNRVHQIQTIGDAAKAGVPEAKEALARANKGEITVNRAYEITKQATTPPRPKSFLFMGRVKPGFAQNFMTAATKVDPIAMSLDRRLRTGEPPLKGYDAREILRFLPNHISLLQGLYEMLSEYVARLPEDEDEDGEDFDDYDEDEEEE